MVLVRKIMIGSTFLLSVLALGSCSTSNTTSGSAGSVYAGGTWVGNITSSTEGFGVRTMRLNLIQETISGTSCFSITGSGTIASSRNSSETQSQCWLGGSVTSDTQSCSSTSTTGATNITHGDLSPRQAGTLVGSQIEFVMTLSNDLTMTFSGTVNNNAMNGIFSSTGNEVSTSGTDADGNPTTEVTGCPAMNGSFKLTK